MQHFTYKDTTYQIDEQGCLLDYKFWDTNFAEGMAKSCEIENLTGEHWDVIQYLREYFVDTGDCPTIFAVCKANGLRPREMKRLFPTGYHRGLCRISGVHYRVSRPFDDTRLKDAVADLEALSGDKHYLVDARGFLVDPENWDANYALHRALEMKIPQGKLTDRHWQVIDYLRATFKKEGKIPTVYATCENCGMELEELESLFPDGYHRGAVKLAGLRFVK